MPTNNSPRRRPSRTASRRSKMLPSLPKARPGLALDTSVSRHRAPAPQQIFPDNAKTQELSFISMADIKALKKQKSINRARQRQLHEAQVSTAQRSYSDYAGQEVQDVPPPYSRSKTAETLQPTAMHKRVKGLRPSPLDLSTDISPSDRAITIGLSVEPNAVPRHSRTPSSPVAAQVYPDVAPQRRPSEKAIGQEAVTPTIVITPAKEDFDFELDQKSSPGHGARAHGHRPTSSIYSRHTNCMPVDGYTPPVPPLPLFAVGKSNRVRESSGTIFEEEASNLKVPKRERKKNLSVCTVFEEDDSIVSATKRLNSQSLLPTPRRSRGWWNVITSPFSAASSRSNAFFWRSPPPMDDGTTARMLDDASGMGSDSHAGLIFTNRTPEDLDLRSAPPIDSERSSLNIGRHRAPKRSDTAPGALDPSGTDGVNIYTVPYVGEAAAYYNPHKNFPSIIMDAGELEASRGLDNWSPSQSVYREPRGSVKGAVVMVDDVDDSDSTIIDDDNPFNDKNGGVRALDDGKSPFSDAHASNVFEGFSGTQPAATADKRFFATPGTEELRGASPQGSVRPEPTRGDTQATVESHFSPLSATPVIEDARMGTLMGPSMVDVRTTPGRTASPHTSGLGAATMASRGINDEKESVMVSERPLYGHQRNDSYGLGIDTDSERMSEKSLFPPPKPLAEQPRLGTDRFGQLRIEKDGDHEPNWAPWYRRFLWPLLGIAASLLILFVVLLVVFIHQAHDDMPVQAHWLNLTGYPAMPTGIATVIQPQKYADIGGCVQPQDLWGCAAPSGMNQDGDEAPNFRFEIRFRNKTRSDMNSTDLVSASAGAYKRSISGASLASALVRRSTWSESLYASLPAPPSSNDMIFLGNTTDNVSAPFAGEETPFYTSLLNTSALEQEGSIKQRLRKRERGDGVYPYPTDSGDPNSNTDSNHTTSISDDGDDGDSAGPSSGSTDAPSDIPRPQLQSNGQPAPAELYPSAYAQPLRLFDRGQDTEHYGFYTYYDRSVYISSGKPSDSNTTSTLFGNGTESITPNTPLDSSNALCIFSQTRLLVQIWTRKSTIAGLNVTSSSSAAIDSSANDMTFPGSFPYPVTVTLDRHGGNTGKKGVYCYGLDAEGRVLSDVKTWIPEDRAFGGEIVNAADIPGVDEQGLNKRDGGGAGKGIDGGDGGCTCAWRNWNGKE